MNDRPPPLSETDRRVLRTQAAARMHPIAVRHMRPAWKRWAVIAAGWTFLVLGVLGLVLPFLQGVLFILIGVALLAREVEWVRRKREHFYRRHPKLREWNHQGEVWVDRQWHRIRAYFRRGA